ncbi:MAG: FAD binding domain-containing protein, partial [Acidobacteriota bacterium]
VNSDIFSRRTRMTAQIHFLLNDRVVSTHESPGLLVLDYLRHRQRLTGTKEGCKEGDCGACTVLIGELVGDSVRYKPVTSCLMPIGELQSKHLVTIEGLNLPDLTPVQQAIVDEGASQCGFCTPGIVVSLTGLLMQDAASIDRESVKTALSGHLCRCTGYRSLKAAGDLIGDAVRQRTGVDALVDDGRLPAWFRAAPAQLQALRDQREAAERSAEPPSFVIAGGTDLYVQQGEDVPDRSVDVLNLRPELKGIERQNGHLRVGALTTFEEFAEHPEVRRQIPEIADYMFLIASWQIRNRATLGGNVVNASPIGDMTVLLLALDSQLVLVAGERHRTVPMRSFFQGYKVMDKAPDEILTEILIPVVDSSTRVHWEKVSKRKCLDIATVNSAIRIRTEGDRIEDVSLAVGGVAPIPLRLEATADSLRGQRLDQATVEGALAVAQGEISPISDVRGSADYKRLLTRQLLIAHFTRLFPDRLAVEDLL